MTAAALAVATPHYQWYSLLLVMLVALDGRPEWLAFAAGGYYAAYPNLGRYTPPWRLEDAIAYGVPLVVVGVGWLIRHELTGARASASLSSSLKQQNRWSPPGSRCSTGARTSGRSPAASGPVPRRVARSPGLCSRPARIRCFLTGWLPAGQTLNGTDHQDRE